MDDLSTKKIDNPNFLALITLNPEINIVNIHFFTDIVLLSIYQTGWQSFERVFKLRRYVWKVKLFQSTYYHLPVSFGDGVWRYVQESLLVSGWY